MANLSRNEKIAIWIAFIVAVFLFLFFGFFNGAEEIVQDDALNIGLNEDDTGDSTAEGLEIETVTAGEGDIAEEGDLLTVHYVGTLENGTVFDSSLDRGEPFQFILGAGQVIAGWEQGVSGMQEGEVRILTIPPDLAYGAQGVGPIPPNATLTFEVELLSAEDISQE